MQSLDAIVVVDFRLHPDERYTKTWKRLGGAVLERRISVPAAVLAVDNVLELPLDGEPRELRIEYVRWEHARQTMYVHVMPTDALASELRRQGIRAWRPWLRKRVAASFMERCRQGGWNIRGVVRVLPPEVQPVVERIEPTL
jgi:hypothetical protein